MIIKSKIVRIRNDQIVNTDDDDDDEDDHLFDGLFSDDDSKWETDEEAADMADTSQAASGIKVEKKELASSYFNGAAGASNADDYIDSVFGPVSTTNATSQQLNVITSASAAAMRKKLNNDASSEDGLSSGGESTLSPCLDRKLLNYQHFERDQTELAFESDLDDNSKKTTNVAAASAAATDHSAMSTTSRINKHNSLSTSESDDVDSSSSSSSSSSDSRSSSSDSSSDGDVSSSGDEDDNDGDDDDDEFHSRTRMNKVRKIVTLKLCKIAHQSFEPSISGCKLRTLQ